MLPPAAAAIPPAITSARPRSRVSRSELKALGTDKNMETLPAGPEIADRVKRRISTRSDAGSALPTGAKPQRQLSQTPKAVRQREERARKATAVQKPTGAATDAYKAVHALGDATMRLPRAAKKLSIYSAPMASDQTISDSAIDDKRPDGELASKLELHHRGDALGPAVQQSQLSPLYVSTPARRPEIISRPEHEESLMPASAAAVSKRGAPEMAADRHRHSKRMRVEQEYENMPESDISITMNASNTTQAAAATMNTPTTIAEIVDNAVPGEKTSTLIPAAHLAQLAAERDAMGTSTNGVAGDAEQSAKNSSGVRDPTSGNPETVMALANLASPSHAPSPGLPDALEQLLGSDADPLVGRPEQVGLLQRHPEPEPLSPLDQTNAANAVPRPDSAVVDRKRNKRPITEAHLAEIQKYAKPGEDLDWTNETDPKRRKAKKDAIYNRKRREQTKLKKATMAEQSGVTGSFSGPAQSPGDRRHLRREKSAAGGLPSPSMTEDAEAGDELSADENETESASESETEQLPALQPVQLIRQEDITDANFVDQVKAYLEIKSHGKLTDFPTKQARRILQLLNLATPPHRDEAKFISTSQEAAAFVQPGVLFDGPIFLENQQSYPLQTVDKFLGEMYDDTVKVYVQDPSMRVINDEPRVRTVKVGAVKKRFAKSVDGKPWNLLELALHCEDGTRPAFLNEEDCRLLTKLKVPSNGDFASRRGFDPGWKEVEKWALVAQAGALTEPHQDSHGYNTYITVNQGILGYGWLSMPTEAEREVWNHHHDSFIGGRWRYVLVRPGQTVYFPTGTVHFVFRLPAIGNTLAFGGHVLRCSQILRWMKTLMQEQETKFITNEDLTVSAPGYLNRVEKFVKQALKTGDTARWGGEAACQEFLRLKPQFVKRQAEFKKLEAKEGK